MNDKITLSKDQIKTLLTNAYAFVDKNGEIFFACDIVIHTYEFMMYNYNNSLTECVVFSYDNCTFHDGKVTFETHDADTEQFKVIAVVNDITTLLK